MDLIDYVRLVRRRWAWIAGFTVAGIIVGLILAFTSPRSYRSTATLFVGNVAVAGSAGPTAAAQSGSDFTLARMASYSALISSPSVSTPVMSQLHLTYGQSGFTSHVSASVPALTVLMHVSATSSNAKLSAELANASATRLGTVIEALEKPSNGGPSPVVVTLTTPATTPSAPASPNKPLLVAIGLIIGLIIGLLAASLREQSVADRGGLGRTDDFGRRRRPDGLDDADSTVTSSTTGSPEYQS